MVRTMMVLIGIILVFAIGGGVVYINNQNSKQSFISDLLNVELVHPSYLIAEERYNNIELKNAKTSSVIRFTKDGTNFDNVQTHVDNLINLNRLRVKERSNVNDPYKGVLLETYVGNSYERSFFFVKDFAVYYFSTDDPALFSDLDSIAKSFRILE